MFSRAHFLERNFSKSSPRRRKPNEEYIPEIDILDATILHIGKASSDTAYYQNRQRTFSGSREVMVNLGVDM